MAAPVQGAYTASLSGTTATFTGDAAFADFVTITRVGGDLRHDRVDPGFASSADFDSTAGGEQTLPDTALAHVIVNGGDGIDVVQFGFAGTAFQAAFTVDGGLGADFLHSPQGTSGADSVILNGSGITGVASGPVQYSNVEQVNIRTAGDNDLVRLDATTGTQTNVYGEDGNDTLRLANGASLGGTFRGAIGTDTLDYSVWTAPVSVDLGKTAMFTATLSGASEVPPVVTAATGDGLVEFTDLATNTFRYELGVNGLTAAQIADSHIHAGAPLAEGGVIFGIGAGPTWSDPAGPFTEATGQSDPDITEPALRAGNTYFNVHTAANPDGEIRGQLALDSDDGYGGPASGTSRALTVENVIGGSGADVLRGNVLPNVLEGRGGADTLTGGEGADTLNCGEGADSVTSDPTDTLIACDLPGPGGGPGPDTTDPETTITKKPKKKSGKRKVKVEFASSEPGSKFTCALNGKAPVPCSSPFRAKSKKGKNTLLVSAIDVAGNADETPAVAKWRYVP